MSRGVSTGVRILCHPVTLDLNGHVAIRGQENLQTPPTELILSQPRREGDQICVNLNREFLAQAVPAC